MKPKFNPGPWKIDGECLGRHFIKAANCKPTDHSIARVDDPHDAALISAAPDLYAALVDLLEASDLDNEVTHQERQAAISALKKARG